MSRVPLLLVLPLLACAALAAPAVARAQSTCTFSAGPTSINFGAYNPAAATPTDSSGSFTYTCSSARARPVIIQLSAGGAGSYNPRQMSLGPDRLNYNLYSDAGRTAIWGSDANPPYQQVSSVPQGSAHGATLTIYGRIPVNQWVAPGVYADSITVTLNF